MAVNPDDLAAPKLIPRSANPLLFYIAVRQNVIVGQTLLREFDDADVNRGLSELPSKVCSKFIERNLQLFNRILAFMKVCGIDCESHEVL